MYKFLLVYLILINIFTFIIFSIDKYKAIKKIWRIKEKKLLFLSLLGGWIGAYMSMMLFKHKISKKSFMIRFSVIILFWIIIVLYFLTKN